jgi:uncharacterized membrane protein
MRAFFVGLAMVVLAAGCAAGEDDEGPGQLLDIAGVDFTADVGTQITYGDVENFLRTRCAWCHSTELSGADRYDAPTRYNYNTYATARAGSYEGLRTVLNGSMPPNGIKLELEEKQLYQAWVNGGMKP